MESFSKEILPDEFYRSLVTTTFCAAQIHLTECQKVVIILSKLCPLPTHLKHLKRVAKAPHHEFCFVKGQFDCVESGANKFQKETCFVLIAKNEAFSEKMLHLVFKKSDVLPPIYKIQVPSHEPITYEQYIAWNHLWPMSWRRPQWNPLVFKKIPRVKSTILKFMHLLSNDTKKCDPICSNSCILCLGESVIASAEHKNEDINSSNINQHPLYSHHVVLQALSRFSQAIRFQKSIVCKKTKRLPVILIKDERPPTSKITQMGFPKPNDPCQNDNVKHSHTTRSIFLKTDPDNLILQKQRLNESQYYATGAVAYLSSEPCIMCAMALLHNRISVAIFPSGTENKVYGGLGGCISLHTNGQLNHRFHVLVVKIK
ncbi:uncharacterized protein LOC128884319 [Hylaeus volcanicus]|uniref:uncharacterized protein LOC128884319 n=1 Tax=Hylaeus volcanicus TaxID=313075 RepID=UPI0023B804EB|nr:uncharacterized protein LOC128884319 [Hylaeus volcanicus]